MAKAKQRELAESWLHIRVTKKAYERLQAVADAESRSLSNLVRLLLEEGLERREGK